MYTLTMKVESIPSKFTGTVEWDDGRKEWFKDGKRLTESIPSKFTGMVERADGRKEWYKDGLRHRLDGPAIEWADGSKDWYKDGKRLTESEFNASNEIPCEVVIKGITYKLVKQA